MARVAAVLAALVLFVASFINPNPGVASAKGVLEPHGIQKITRHPSFVAFSSELRTS